jgi:hypothetical protein
LRGVDLPGLMPFNPPTGTLFPGSARDKTAPEAKVPIACRSLRDHNKRRKAFLRFEGRSGERALKCLLVDGKGPLGRAIHC